jgi:lysophospholipase L1-like esterase
MVICTRPWFLSVVIVSSTVVVTAGCGSNADTPASGAGGAGAALSNTGGAGGLPPGSGGTYTPPGGGGYVPSTGATTGTGNTVGTGSGPSGNGGFVGGTGGQVGNGGVAGAGATSQGGGGTASGGASPMGGAGAGNGGAGTGGAGGAGTGGAGGASGKNPCITKPSQIVLIGDSYITGFAGTPALQPALAMLEPTAAMWRNYAIAGISMAQGGIPLGAPVGVSFVPDEFTEAVAADKDIKFVIMDGGGNDALLPPGGSPAVNCKNEANSGTDPNCQMLVATTLAAADKLVMNMADAGVKNILYFFYPHLPGTGVLSGTNPNAIDDYSVPIVKNECAAALTKTGGKLSCTFIDTIPAFGMDYATNISSDGVHPTAAGQVILATQIINTMKANCLGQTSGCCAP